MRECTFLFLWVPVSAGNIFRIMKWKTIIYTPRWNMHSIVYPTQYTCDFVESCYIVFSFNSWGFGISVWVTLKWKWCYIHKIFITDYTEIVILTKFNGASDDNFIKIKPLRFPCTWPAVKHQLEWSNAPANTQRNKYVIITSKRRFHVIIMCLLLRCVFPWPEDMQWNRRVPNRCKNYESCTLCLPKLSQVGYIFI